jgi:hypothetical protein
MKHNIRWLIAENQDLSLEGGTAKTHRRPSRTQNIPTSIRNIVLHSIEEEDLPAGSVGLENGVRAPGG